MLKDSTLKGLTAKYYYEGKKDPVFFARHILGVSPHQKQEEWLKNSREKVNVWVPGNRSGKTVATAVKHIWYCFYKVGLKGSHAKTKKIDYQTLNISPHSFQATQCFNYIWQILTSSFAIRMPNGKWKTNKCKISGFFAKKEKSPIMRLLFSNNSQIWIRSTNQDFGDSIQGQNFAYISYDECARSRHLADEIELNLRPRLLDLDGKLDLISTPYPLSVSFTDHMELYQAGKQRKPGYYAQGGTIYDNTYLNKKEIEAQEKTMDESAKRISLYGEFVLSSASFFSIEEIKSCINRKLKFEKPIKTHKYLFIIMEIRCFKI